MECGHRFRTVWDVEKAAFGAQGCPKCGGADIDLADSPPPAAEPLTPAQLRRHFEQVCALITNPWSSDRQVNQAVAQFKTLDADPVEKERCVLAIEDTMGARTGAR
jgi:hypothetical protein